MSCTIRTSAWVVRRWPSVTAATLTRVAATHTVARRCCAPLGAADRDLDDVTVPRMNPADVTEFLLQPHIGVLASLRRDGRPDAFSVWFLHLDDAFWITGMPRRTGLVPAAPWRTPVRLPLHRGLLAGPRAHRRRRLGRRPRAARAPQMAGVEAARRQVPRSRRPRGVLRGLKHGAPPAVRARARRVPGHRHARYQGKRADREYQQGPSGA